MVVKAASRAKHHETRQELNRLLCHLDWWARKSDLCVFQKQHAHMRLMSPGCLSFFRHEADRNKIFQGRRAIASVSGYALFLGSTPFCLLRVLSGTPTGSQPDWGSAFETAKKDQELQTKPVDLRFLGDSTKNEEEEEEAETVETPNNTCRPAASWRPETNKNRNSKLPPVETRRKKKQEGKTFLYI